MTRDQKLQRWAERELQRNIDHLILDDQDGRILAFGVFSIVPDGNGALVLQDGETRARFSSRKMALSWCVAQRRSLLNFSDHMRLLDQTAQQLRQDIRASRAQVSNARDRDFAQLLLDKIQNKQWYVSMLDCELEKCAQRAKYLQLRGSTHETARARAA